MTVFSNFSPTSIYAGDFPRATRPIVVAQGSNQAGLPLRRGTVLGRVTATDKYIPSVKTASDGSQVPAAILVSDVDASAADQGVKGYFTGQYAGEALTIDASFTIATLEAALRAANVMLFVSSVGIVA